MSWRLKSRRQYRAHRSPLVSRGGATTPGQRAPPRAPKTPPRCVPAPWPHSDRMRHALFGEFAGGGHRGVGSSTMGGNIGADGLGDSTSVYPQVLDQFRKEARRRPVWYQTLVNEVLAQHVGKHVAFHVASPMATWSEMAGASMRRPADRTSKTTTLGSAYQPIVKPANAWSLVRPKLSLVLTAAAARSRSI